MALIQKFRVLAAAIGFRDASLYVLSRTLDALFRGRVRIVKYYFMAQPVAMPAAADRSGVFALGFASCDSPLFAQIERPRPVIEKRFAQGARCIAATVDGTRLAGFLWFVIGEYEEDEVRARFVPAPEGHSAWDFDVTILPQYRMGRLFGYLWRKASSELATRGIKQSISRISAFNAGSLSSHRRLGARKVGEAFFLCVGRWQLAISSLLPRWNLSWRDDRAPVFVIEA